MAEPTETGIRLRLAMSAAGIGERELVEKIGAGTSYVRDIVYGRSKNPQGAKLRAAADVLDVDVQWLLGAGPREMLPRKNGGGFAESCQAAVEWTPPPRSHGDNRPALEDLPRLLCPTARSPAWFRVAASATSFGVFAGDLVIVDLGREAMEGDLVVVSQRNEEHATGSTVFRRYANRFLIPPEGGINAPITVADGRYTVVRGPVVAVVRAPALTEA